MINNKQEICFILLPGFAPDDFPVFGIRNILEEKGYKVITSPFFGNLKPKDFSKLSEEDMLRGSFEVINNAAKKYKKIVGIGISLGGALFLEYAKQKNLTAIISVGTPFRLSQRCLIVFLKIIYPLIYPLWRYVDKRYVNFRLLPIGAGKMVVNFLKNNFLDNLNNIQTPVLFLHSKKDLITDYRYLQKNVDKISSKDKKIVLFNNGGHIINRDSRIIANQVLDFIDYLNI